MKLLLIIVYWLHDVSCRPIVAKSGFNGDASDKRFLENVVKEKWSSLSRGPEMAEMGA